MKFTDYYQVMGLTAKANADDIETAYRKPDAEHFIG